MKNFWVENIRCFYACDALKKGYVYLGPWRLCFLQTQAEKKRFKHRALSGEMVTFLLSQAISMFILIIFHHSYAFLVSEINILRSPSHLFAFPPPHSRFLFHRRNIIIIFCHTQIRRRSHATLFMMNKFMFCRLKKMENNKKNILGHVSCCPSFDGGEWDMRRWRV